jgi:cbb3-type cytochrome oxidase subunit 3
MGRVNQGYIRKRKGVIIMFTSVTLEAARPRPDTLRALLLVPAVIGMIAVNALANIQRFGGVTTGEMSDRYPTLITPSNYAFSIWTVIFIGFLTLAIYQALPAQRTNETLRALRGPLLLNALFNALWIFAFHAEWISLSLLLILSLLATLVIVYKELERRPVASSTEWWLVRAPISIYFAWVTVATVVNTAVALKAAGWDGTAFISQVGAVLVLAGVGFLGAWLARRKSDIPLTLTYVWALIAIGVKQAAYPVVDFTAYAAAGAVFLALLSTRLTYRRRFSDPAPPPPLHSRTV